MVEEITLDEYKTAYREMRIEEEKRSFTAHLIVYLIVNVMLIFINLAYSSDVFWFFYPLLGWGIGLAMHYLGGVHGAESALKDREAKAEYRARERIRAISRLPEQIPQVSQLSAPPLQPSSPIAANIFCVKCRKKVEAKDAHEEILKNKRKAMVGICPNCGTKVLKIIAKEKAGPPIILPEQTPQQSPIPSPSETSTPNAVVAFCVKCRKKVEVKNAHEETLKNKRQAIVGICPNCATKVLRIIKKPKSRN